MSKEFKIADHLPSSIATRKAISAIVDDLLIPEDKTVVFDFQNIDFISRAFTDEFIHYIKDNEIYPIYKNRNKMVKSMMDAVMKNRTNQNRNKHIIAVTHLSNQEDINRILSLI
ncbi:MAG: hypothetical protein U9Q98_09460 [Bacteroidota bacterium]|nr:hypothetical protein [Bacteroidota bacterium]